MTILRWLVAVELLGLASWPLCLLLFGRLPDGGLGVARLLGILVASYAAWLSASAGLFPFDAASCVCFTLIFAAAAALLWRLNAEGLVAFLSERRRILVFEELLFLGLFLFAALVQAYKPDITLAEKEPDMMFLQSVLKGRIMPPEDLWFAGKPVNYYYFGYVVFAFLVNLAAAAPEVGFNLAVATVVPLSCVGAFSLAYNLTGRRGWALLAPLFLLGLGNLHAFLLWIGGAAPLYGNWFMEMFGHGSREIIPGTIHEFPCFSFLLGDLHPHFMFMPFSFLLLTLLLTLCLRRGETAPSLSLRGASLFGFFLALTLGSVYMFNTWDYPLYAGLTVLATLALSKSAGGNEEGWAFLAWPFLVIVGSIVLFLPFRLWFEPAAGLRVGLVDAARRSPLGGFGTVNGLGCFVAFSMLGVEVVRAASRGELRMEGKALFLTSAAAGIVVGAITRTAVAGIMCAACILAAVRLISGRGTSPELVFSMFLVLLLAGVFLGCEFFYLKDFYGERLQRQNTVFKYYFTAWILCSAVFAAGSMHVVEALRGVWKAAWVAMLAALVAASLVYPIMGTYHRCERFRGGRTGAVPYLPTLDGMAYIRHRTPGEYKALKWAEENIPEGQVVLEATGDPYSFYGRVSTFAGRPTVLGWGNQESLWRDWTWKLIMERTEDIARIYNERRKGAVKHLLDRYGIRYIYVGTLERKKYRAEGLEAFAAAYPLVYRSKEVSIYKL